MNFVADYSQAVCTPTVAKVASGKGHAQTTLVNGRDSAHDWVLTQAHPTMMKHLCSISMVCMLTAHSPVGS